jgi:hypothetical protein
MGLWGQLSKPEQPSPFINFPVSSTLLQQQKIDSDSWVHWPVSDLALAPQDQPAMTHPPFFIFLSPRAGKHEALELSYRLYFVQEYLRVPTFLLVLLRTRSSSLP